ncbi:ATP-dependent Clp protease ATP-binding subunit [Clostridium formicaceticum]|uniref:ATP-dependent Clp protease ATP-binding subunit ClpC n=1 Tax=Clostridium formicaceticum TaxID=1497 RepID=A0AAC9WI59_9CLOT|nr:ATP-dependent Clp protease ATP-binding subunit [Clostridium formicaceticum]AOY75252.1 chaperone ClpB [Clostridium formicaceticum]ARE89686.1 ATP-dependent Clp protease ATP-binding subunit ClpC [Clostridium formicaceticum]
MKKCSICNKNTAVVFATKFENGKSEMKGICIPCAKKMGLPVVDQLMQQTGMTEEEIENLTEDIADTFEEEEMDMGGLENHPSLMNLFNNDSSLGEDDTHYTSRASDYAEEDTKKKKSKRKKKNLEMYGTNLTEKAKNNEVDRVVGRHREIDRVVQILNRRTKNNPILVGEPGVGKTAIAEGLALRIIEKQVPAKLFNVEVYLLDLTAIVAGTQFRGQFEGRMKAIIKEAQDCGNIILVIDEVHNIMGAGEVHGGVMNAANILKPALAKGEIQIIGATTLEEYRKHIEKDTALERRFQPVIVEEPTIEETIEILKGIRGYYEEYHKVKISDKVIEAAAKLSERYITDRYLPDKAIDVIDEAGSRANLKNQGLVELEALREAYRNMQYKRELAAEGSNYEKAAEYKVEECRLLDKIKLLEEACEDIQITEEDVAFVIEAWTKIPVQKITEKEAQKLLKLEDHLHQRIIGQKEAIKSLARTIRRNRSGFRKKKKPSSFIFVGPTGVGKTEVVRALAEELFGSEEAMIRMDMSEYMEKHTVSKLIGAPPGYVGYDQGGQLTEKVRRKPYSVILLDEMEKAHPDVFNLLLQILEDGRLTDSQGRTVYFENAVIIMTSNVGTQLKSTGIGFGKDHYEVLEGRIKEALRETFRPEFLNRIDETIVFTKLNKEELYKIIDLMLKEVLEEVKEKDMTLEVTEEVKAFILEKGYDEKYGARPLRRTIQKYIEDEIAEDYLQNKFVEGDHIKIALKEGKVMLETAQ